tara:strand:- start:1120 stop:1407 length:288 start_codon:yes stop_codon:yes gene_type:complete
MSKIETTSISFNVSKSINIGNFEAVKINYGQSITVDPTKPVEIQREMLIEECYKVVKKETEIWEGLKSIQHIDRNKKTNVVKAKSFTSFKDQQEH